MELSTASKKPSRLSSHKASSSSGTSRRNIANLEISIVNDRAVSEPPMGAVGGAGIGYRTSSSSAQMDMHGPARPASLERYRAPAVSHGTAVSAAIHHPYHHQGPPSSAIRKP